MAVISKTSPDITPKEERRRPRTIVQVGLFLVIFIILQGLFAIPLILGPLRQALDGIVVTHADGSSVLTFSLDTLEPLLTALSPGGWAGIVLAGGSVLATVGAIIAMRFMVRGPRLLDLGLRLRPGWLGQFVLGLIIGPIMFGAILLIEVAAGWARIDLGSISIQTFLAAFVTFAFVAVSEELLARGFLLQVLERDYGTATAALGSSAIFSLLHAFNPGVSVLALSGLFAAGLLFAYAYLVTRQLWLPIALHLSWNLSQGPIFGFPVSGLSGSGLVNPDVSGPVLFTGGAFGPEAGLVGLMGIGLAAGIIAAWRQTHRPWRGAHVYEK